MELKGTRGLFDTVKSSRTRSVATVSLRLGVSPGFWGYFGRKMAVFGPKLRKFGRAPPDLAPPPRAATGEFLAQNLDLARPPPMLQDGYMGKRSEALRRSNGQNGTETCCCLLLLLAKFKVWENSSYTDQVIPTELQPEGYTPTWCTDIHLLRARNAKV